MNPKNLLALAALPLAGTLAGAAIAPAGHDLRPAFTEGQKLLVTNEIHATLGLDDMAASMGGMELPETPTVDIEFTMVQELEEEVLAVDDAGLKKLRRYHDSFGVEVAGEAGMMGQMETIDESEDLPLEGRTLEITRNEDGGVDVEDVSEGDLDALDDVMIKTSMLETHFESLLPKAPVDVGESWDVGAAMIEDFTRQASAQAEGDDEAARLFEAIQSIMDDYELDATGRLLSVEGGEAQIAYSLSGEIVVEDLFELIRDIADPEDIEGMPENAEGRLEVGIEMEGTGVFDMTLRQLTSLEIEGEYVLSADMSMSQDGMEMEGNADISGTIEMIGSVTAAE